MCCFVWRWCTCGLFWRITSILTLPFGSAVEGAASEEKAVGTKSPFVGYASSGYARYIPKKIFERVEAYLLPLDHPLKEKLDTIFSKGIVLEGMKSLVAAGFQKTKPQPTTKLIFTRHPLFPGYVFKLYLNEQKFFYKRPEYETWIQRVRGVRLLEAEISQKGWQAYFKVPQKWIYPLPEKIFAMMKGRWVKRFILVEEEMDILTSNENRRCWHDGTIKTERVDQLYYLVTRVGLRGGCKLDNIPLCRDGRIAFIDTENHFSWPVPYYRLYSHVQGKMAKHWKKLVKEGKKSEGRIALPLSIPQYR